MRESERWAARERERSARMKQERGPQSALASILTDVGVCGLVAAVGLAIVACCGPTAPRDPSWPCRTTLVGRDVTAPPVAADTVYWREYQCPDSSRWHETQRGERYRIK